PGADSEHIPRRFDAGLRATTARSNDETHISTSEDKRRPRFTGPQNPVPTVDKSVGPTDLAQGRETIMKLGTAIAEIMKREGIEILCGYPVNHLIEHAANANIRPIMVRQERIGLHMADAISRVTSGRS